jgi:O-antigen/teichoic acid export membrane protein
MNKVIGKNISLNWFGHGIGLIAMFFITPFVIQRLGNVEYGIWSLLVVFVGYFGLIELGVRSSCGRYIALYLGKNDLTMVNKTVQTSLFFFLFVGFVLLTITPFIIRLFPIIFPTLPKQYLPLINILLPFLVINLIFASSASVYSSILAAYDRFDLYQVINISSVVVKCVAIVLLIDFGISGLMVASLLFNVFLLLGNFLLAKKIFPMLRLWPLSFHIERLKELMGYGFAAFLFSVAYRLINQTDLFLVGSLISVDKVTVYSIAGMLILYSWGFIEQIGKTLFPVIQKKVAANNRGEVIDLFFKHVRITFLVGVPLYLMFIFFGKSFITLWMGVEYLPASKVLVILSLVRILYVFSISSGPTLAAFGYIKVNTFLSVVEAVLNILFSIIFITYFKLGLVGVALGTLVAALLARVVIHPVYACRVLKVSLVKYFNILILPAGTALVLYSCFCFFVKNIFTINSWLQFFLMILVSGLSWCVIAYFVIITPREKFVIKKEIKAKFAVLLT